MALQPRWLTQPRNSASTKVQVAALSYALAAITLFSAAYLAEAIRGASRLFPKARNRHPKRPA